jgi:hypothetical protein
MDPVASLPRYAADAAQLRAAPLPNLREVLGHHEAAGTIDAGVYQTVYLKFFRRHVCRLDPMAEPVERTFAQLKRDDLRTHARPQRDAPHRQPPRLRPHQPT